MMDTAWLTGAVGLVACVNFPSFIAGILVGYFLRFHFSDSESKLNDNYERFRLVVEAAPNAMIKVDASGVIVLVNKQAERMFGYERNELLGRKIEALIPERFHCRHFGYRNEFFAHPSARPMGAGRELFARRKDGSEFPVEIGLNPMETSNGVSVLSSIVDITERKREEERFRLVVEAAPNGMILVDETGQIILVNQQAERMFGYSRNELLGTQVEKLIPERSRAAHPTYRGQFFACPSIRAMGGGRDLHGRRKDGSEFPVEIGLNPLDAPSGRCVLSAIVDITERKRFEKLEAEQLLSRREVLEARARMDLLATMSHEIRTPLTSIIGSVELLKDAVLDEGTTQCIADIQRCSNVLLTIINNILDWSKLEAGSFKSDRLLFHPRQLLEDVNAILAGDIRSKELVFTIDCEDRVPRTVVGDRGRLSQILLNLCCNAVKFTDRGGVLVKMGFKHCDNQPQSTAQSCQAQYRLTFEVRDSGQGMSTDLLPRLFQPFTQADNSTTRRNSGTGLGLAIVKKLITLLGGSIACDSKLGLGTSFTFDILVDVPPMPFAITADSPTSSCTTIAEETSGSPLLSPSGGPSQSVECSPAISLCRVLSTCSTASTSSSSSVCISTDSDADARACQTPNSLESVTVVGGNARPTVTVDPPIILVVEDVAVIQRVVRAMLSKLGYATEAVSNGLEAVSACDKSQYALIFMDCEMPVMDGFAATAQIKRNKGSAAPPIIAMTANALMGDRERCLQAGMDGYLSKPVLIADLRRSLSQFLGMKANTPNLSSKSARTPVDSPTSNQ